MIKPFGRTHRLLGALLLAALVLGGTGCQPEERVDSRLQRVILDVPIGEKGVSTEQQIGEADLEEDQ